MDQQQAPIWDKIKEYNAEQRLRLHVPGHGGGSGLPLELHAAFLTYAQMDLTELPGLDDLFNPRGIIADAQALAAELFNAKQTFFLVNGASAGVLAMVLAVCGPGDHILVPRNAHGSLYHGLIVAGAIPTYLPIESKEGFPLNVSFATVAEAIRRCPQAKALVLTSPSYFGVAANMADIAQLVHDAGMLLLVDEAHGSHLGFDPRLPTSAAPFCDLRVQSWHKTLGALTPGAVLHLHSDSIDVKRIQTALQWVQTSSPAYPVLASLDAVRRHMFFSGSQITEAMVSAALSLRERINMYVPLLQPADLAAGMALDCTRITCLTAKIGVNGIFAAELLTQSGIDVELAQPDCLLALVGPGFAQRHAVRLLETIKQLPNMQRDRIPFLLPPVPEPVLSPREAVFSLQEEISYKEAGNRIAVEMVVSYPPGIPVLAPGERIDGPVIEYLEFMYKQGALFRGFSQSGSIRVCKERL